MPDIISDNSVYMNSSYVYSKYKQHLQCFSAAQPHITSLLNLNNKLNLCFLLVTVFN